MLGHIRPWLDGCEIHAFKFTTEREAMTHTDHDQPPYQPQAPASGTTRKDDQGKLRLDLLPTEALEEVAAVLQHGAAKYGEHNWRLGTSWRRLIAAALRHIFAWLRTEDTDPESSLPHLAHAACSLLFLMTYSRYALGTDDRLAH
jgi:hypothetical protein